MSREDFLKGFRRDTSRNPWWFLVARARHLHEAMQLYVNSVEHWNREHPDEDPIDPDADGELAAARTRLEELLNTECRDVPQ